MPPHWLLFEPVTPYPTLPPQGEFLMNTGSLGVVGVSSGSSNVSYTSEVCGASTTGDALAGV